MYGYAFIIANTRSLRATTSALLGVGVLQPAEQAAVVGVGGLVATFSM